MTIIDGKKVSQAVYDSVARKTAVLRDSHGVTPGLAVVIVGNDPASEVYVRSKVKRAEEAGMKSVKHELAADATQDEVLSVVRALNDDPSIHGILVQSPPPPQINEREIIETISVHKDVDCFHPYNVGKLLIGDTDGFAPCTPAGVVALLDYYDVDTQGKHAVIIGRSNIVGKPMAALLVQKASRGNCTVTIAHSRTANLKDVCVQADIVIAAIGKPAFVSADMVKEGAVVIDVGINRVDDASSSRGYRLVGDVDYPAVCDKASFITPVPGGVGAMTIAILLQNTVKACKKIHGIANE